MAYRNSSMMLAACMALVPVALVACGDDGGVGDTAASMDSSGSGTAGTGTSGSATVTDTTPTPPGDSTGTSSTTDDPTEGATMGTTEGATNGTSSGDETAGETEGAVCEGLEAKACMNNEACMAIGGTPIHMMGDAACLGPREFLDCQPNMGCGDAITFACEGDGTQMYRFIDTCIPTGWVECGPPPGVELGPCPD